MGDEEQTNWLDDLFEEIDELLSNRKSVKFNTNANRKACIRKIQASVKEAIDAHTTLKVPLPDQTPSQRRGLTITRPNTNKVQGFAVMTEELSSKGDDIIQNKPADPYANKIKNHNKGVRHW